LPSDQRSRFNLQSAAQLLNPPQVFDVFGPQRGANRGGGATGAGVTGDGEGAGVWGSNIGEVVGAVVDGPAGAP
jgi:hypothetical protein